MFYLMKALYASKIVSYAQGFMLLREAAQVHNWDLDYGSIALMWRGGCIIRSVFLGQIKAAFDKDSNLRSLLLAPFFLDALKRSQTGWRNTVVTAVNLGKYVSINVAKLFQPDTVNISKERNQEKLKLNLYYGKTNICFFTK